LGEPIVVADSRHEQLKAMLESKLAIVEQDVQNQILRLRGQSQEPTSGESGIDFGDGDIECAVAQMKTTMVRRIRTALQRLRVGTYGICENCEAEIEENRLRALPFAAKCHKCQDREDQTRGLKRLETARSPFGVELSR
jgi:DnaK suppressor protein